MFELVHIDHTPLSPRMANFTTSGCKGQEQKWAGAGQGNFKLGE
jgi:hypothetical protein